MRLTFGSCVADFDVRELLVAGRPVHVEPRAFRLLGLLIGARPRVVSREELHEALWPGTFVTERSLARLVWELRKALGDDPDEPRYIRTVPRCGYAFCAHAGSLASPYGPDAGFDLVWAGSRFELHEGENILGREQDATVQVNVGSVSRRHARITISGEGATLEDLGSKNGTFLNGVAVTSPAALAEGDRVRLGTAEMIVRRYERSLSTQSVQ